MAIIWREQMSVGNTLIDREHRTLIDLFGQLEPALKTKENHDTLLTALDRLVDYTGYHFGHEEQIQHKIGYPNQHKHKQEHLRIMRDLYTIKQQLEKILGSDRDSGSDPTDMEVSDDELSMLLEDDDAGHNVDPNDLSQLVELMRRWVLDHVLGTDLKMKPFLTKYPADLK